MGIFNSWLSSNDDIDSQEAMYKLDNNRDKPHSIEEQINIRNAISMASLSTKLVVTDAANVIVSVNESALRMLEGVQNALKQSAPEFNLANIVGSKLSIIKASEADKFSSLEEAKLTRISIAGLIVDQVASPIFSKERTRLGTVVEWVDVTEQVKTEEDTQALLQQAKESVADNSKVKSALDQLDTAMMIVGTTNVVEYGNNSLFQLFRVTEAEFRKEMPAFSSGNIIGTSLNNFCKGTSIKSSGRTELNVGSRIFQMRFSPLADSNGKACGTVIEWKDKTDEIEFEKNILKVVEDAIVGELNSRIDSSSSDSNIASMAAKINLLLETFNHVITETGTALSSLSEGKLTYKISAEFKGVFGKLKGDVNTTVDKLISVVNEIRECSFIVKSGAGEITSGNHNLSQRTEQQAASLEETSAAMEEITSTVQQNAANSVQANTLARGARETAENGGDVVNNAVAAMQAISESSSRINDIIGVIDEIAFQTNLLALNAAVEAARAGDQGRGFAVVADEVRNLAGRSAKAAKEIKELIKDSGEKVKEGSRLVNESGDTLHEIVTAVKKVNDIVAEISTASDEQATGLDEINKAVGEMDDMTQQNAALVEEAAAASEALGQQAEVLEKLIGFFDLGSLAVKLLHESTKLTSQRSTPVLKPKTNLRPSSARAAVQLKKPSAKAPAREEAKPFARKNTEEDDKNWEEF